METIYRRLEAWGCPLAAIDWLRNRRLLVIVVLALLSWVSVVAIGMGLHAIATQLWFPLGGGVAAR